MAAKIKEDILTKGWCEKKQAFTMAYGIENMDAANLLMLHYGFLKPDDPRMISTVRQRTLLSFAPFGWSTHCI